MLKGALLPRVLVCSVVAADRAGIGTSVLRFRSGGKYRDYAGNG